MDPNAIFDNPVSVADVAADIGAGLAKATLAGVVNGEVVMPPYLMSKTQIWRLLPIVPMKLWILFVTLGPLAGHGGEAAISLSSGDHWPGD